MKTNKQNNNTNNTTQASTRTVSELKNRSEQRGETGKDKGKAETEKAEAPEAETATVNAPVRPYVNFAERDFNRKLSVEKVLEKLQRWMPEQFKLAEVVGKWIWIRFEQAPVERVRADLSQLGFHWNNTRKVWQHPCGETLPRGQQEPREKYDTFFPALSRRSEGKADQLQAAA